jgi:hypothetical protein
MYTVANEIKLLIVTYKTFIPLLIKPIIFYLSLHPQF